MKLYDDVIKQWLKLTEGKDCKHFPVNADEKWPDAGKRNLVLGSDMAFELGGSIKPLTAAGGTAVTSDSTLVSEDEIILIGKDLCEIKEETPYARLSLCLVDDSYFGEGDKLFSMIKAIEYVRYHVNPEGFMMRVSTSQKRESVRVSKEAVKKGISFENAGNLMLKQFHKNPAVKAVKLIFIDDASFDFKTLEESVKKCGLITETIDHIGKNAIMSCDTCNLQVVCNEVEGMKELHFKQQ